MKMGWRKNYVRQKGYFMNIMRQYRERADIRVYLEILLSLLTISVFSVFALRPTLLTIAELLKVIESKKETLAIMNQKIENLSSAQIQYDQNRDKIFLLKTSIPDYPKPNDVLRQYEGLISKNGIDLVNITFGDAPLKGAPQKSQSRNTKSEGAAENTLSVKASFATAIDNYSGVSSMVNDFANHRLPLSINQLSVSTAVRETEEILLINLDGYFLYNDKSK